MNEFKVYLNCKYGVGEKKEAMRITLGIDEYENKILETNDWLYLVNSLYINEINNMHEILKNCNNFKLIEETVIPFIPTYSHGTVHGFSSFYSMLLKYINNGNLLEEHSLMVYDKCCPAYLEVLNYLFNNGILYCKKIISISDNDIYKLNKCIIIPNTLHSFCENKNESNAIELLIINNFNNISFNKINNICILKNNKSNNNTHLGLIPEEIVNKYCKDYNLTLIEPGHINELELFYYLQSCELCFISWSSFLKNVIYFSKNCKKINVIIYGNEFYREYNILKDRNQLPHMILYTHIDIEYILI
jgi:hypothetical protein